MRALQGKLRALEEENHQLKNALNANDRKGDSRFADNTNKCRGMSGIELLEVVLHEEISYSAIRMQRNNAMKMNLEKEIRRRMKN